MRLKTRSRTLIAALPAAAFLILTISCTDPQNDKAAQPQAEAGAREVGTPTGLKYVDLKVGEGPEATTGNVVKVHYTGRLENGTKFDSSLDRQEPFTFRLGAGEVIEGWDQGIAGMKVGGKRQLTIPSDLGYGDQGSGAIPPGATLIFEVQLLGIE
ncbi:MAG: peptidylprolyl isomerase [Acidobacteriota bacterium]|jgi:FKBP-type peptidyl-prolyl cis-trans isomerase|nr:peptidylprolyl isomerase [Acidobacteriota bacterium]